MDIAAKKVESERANSYESRKRSIYEGYRRTYTHIAKDFVSIDDFNVFLGDLKRLLEDSRGSGSNAGDSSRLTVSALTIESDLAHEKIIKRGMSDFDGSRVDMDMRINSVSKISTRFF
jgi:hypothetical protein